MTLQVKCDLFEFFIQSRVSIQLYGSATICIMPYYYLLPEEDLFPEFYFLGLFNRGREKKLFVAAAINYVRKYVEYIRHE